MLCSNRSFTLARSASESDGLHSVFVAGAQFHRIETGGLQGPYDGFQIHVGEYVVGDGAEQHAPILTPEFDQFVKITRAFRAPISARSSGV